jgi:DUF1680 family protein
MQALAATTFALFCATLCAQTAVPFTQVKVTDRFWAPRIETNRRVTIPYAFGKDEETGRVKNFERAAKVLHGEQLDDRTPPGYPFDDTDVYKVIEGAAYALAVERDVKLEAYVDDLIQKVAAAQEKDGYLYTTRTIDAANPHKWAGKERWEMETDLSHELYNLGHLYEAAVAYNEATGKRALLDVALKSANLLEQTFGPGKRVIWPGHQIVEMGLVKLYQASGDARYLDLAKFMLDSRGPGALPAAGREYNQSHKRVVEQDTAVGHAVRATYMYAGMADIAALKNETSYLNALDRIWENLVARKMYLTGGIGSTSNGEAFGADFELPNMTAYNETCAAIGSEYWNFRLGLAHQDAKYMDVVERTLYNGMASGVGLDGKTFFYPNPLESNGQHERSPWFGCACCPGNVTRFVASVPGYIYAQKDSNVWVNLYMANSARIKLPGGDLKLSQRTDYPWDGAIRIRIEAAPAAPVTLRLRIPGWARNEPAPGGLYHYVDAPAGAVTLKVNGKATRLNMEKSYAVLTRAWRASDVVELMLPMAPRRVAADERVKADRGRMALERGPIVYALEWADNPEFAVRALMVDGKAPIRVENRKDLLGGVLTLTGAGTSLEYAEDGSVKEQSRRFTAIPYATWANRGRGQMTVWIPTSRESARPAPFKIASMRAKVTASGKRNPRAVNDGEEPEHSADSSSAFDWWPAKGTTEWVELAFDKPERVSEASVYWFDDAGSGEVRVPESWRLLYKDGSEWKPVEGGGGVEKDRYNTLRFGPVVTTAVRLEVQARKGFAAGLCEWRVK